VVQLNENQCVISAQTSGLNRSKGESFHTGVKLI